MDDNLDGAFLTPPAGTIDRPSRDRLAADIREFLEDRITAFELDERIFDAPASEDTVVRFVSNQVWLFYDDCKDHQVVMDRRGWKYLQRLLLLLESECGVTVERRRRWAPSQLFAAAALACFAFAVWWFGWSQILWLVTIPLGVVALLIARVRLHEKGRSPATPYCEALAPFNSFSDLRAVVDATPRFMRSPFRPEVARRTIRTDSYDAAMRLQSALSWLLYSPIYLAGQCLPLEDSSYRVIVPGRARR